MGFRRRVGFWMLAWALPALACALTPADPQTPPLPPTAANLATEVAILRAENATLAAQVAASVDQPPAPQLQTPTIVPATLALTSEANSSPPPITTTLVPTQPLTILDFSVQVEDFRDGKRLRFNWKSEGGIAAFIENGASPNPDAPSRWTTPPSGSLTVELAETFQPNPTFTIFVYNQPDISAAEIVSQTAQIAWECRQSYFFAPLPAQCPIAPKVHGWSAEQRFERGRMIWFHEIDENNVTQNKNVYVLYNQPVNETQWEIFADSWRQGEPVNQPAIIPPNGLFQPERILGKLWRENERVRGGVGWANGYEQGYFGARQNGVTDETGSILYLQSYSGQILKLISQPDAGNRWEELPAYAFNQ